MRGIIHPLCPSLGRGDGVKAKGRKKKTQKNGERGCLSPKTLVIKVPVTGAAVYTAVLAIFFQLLKISPSRGLAGRGGGVIPPADRRDEKTA